MTNKIRQNYLDIVKGIAILLVIVGHLQLDNVIRNFVYSFHIPIFFYIGGVIYRKKVEIPYHRIKYLFLNYLAFGFLFIILITLKEKSFDIELVYNLIKSNPISIYNIKLFGVFWFILAYGVVLILSKIKLFSYISTSLFIFIMLYYIQNTAIFDTILYLPLCLAPAFVLLIFFNIGKYNDSIIKKYSIKNLILVFIIFIILNIANIYFYDGFSTKLINYGVLHFEPSILLVLSVALSGIVLVLFISLYINSKLKTLSNILIYFGKHSMFLFIWHILILALVRKIMIKVISNEEYQFLISFQLLKLFITILILVILINTYERIKLKYRKKI